MRPDRDTDAKNKSQRQQTSTSASAMMQARRAGKHTSDRYTPQQPGAMQRNAARRSEDRLGYQFRKQETYSHSHAADDEGVEQTNPARSIASHSCQSKDESQLQGGC